MTFLVSELDCSTQQVVVRAPTDDEVTTYNNVVATVQAEESAAAASLQAQQNALAQAHQLVANNPDYGIILAALGVALPPVPA